MRFEVIEDTTQMKPDDILEFRCPNFGVVTQWRVEGVYLGTLHVESLIEVVPLTNKAAHGHRSVMVPEQMTRMMTIIRAMKGGA